MNISGVVFDTTGKKTLANVSVLTVRIKDSLLLMSTRTKPDGSFSLTNFPIDTFSLIIEHPEYEAKTYYIIGHKGNLEINIPRIQLNSVTKNLAEVVVFANKNPVFYREVKVPSSFTLIPGSFFSKSSTTAFSPTLKESAT